MENFVLYIVYFVAVLCAVFAGEMTFELPDNERECFFEQIDKNIQCTLEFQVITGGNYDVDMQLTAPNGQVLYKDVKKQYDSFTWTTQQKGVYKFCFSNEFSTITHKLVYFDFQVGQEKSIVENIDDHATAMTFMESSCVGIHEEVSKTIDFQTHHRLRESQGRAFAESLNERVTMWSFGQTIVILIIGVGQVLVLRSFFTDKKNLPTKT